MSINNIDSLCNICGDDLDNKFVYTTDCNHKFHYECLQKSFLKELQGVGNNICPLCRTPIKNLPIVNGLKKLKIGVHFYTYEEFKDINHNNIMCQYILKSGKNKGSLCNKNCKIGYNFCGQHFKKKII